jgi:hypothetical protein
MGESNVRTTVVNGRDERYNSERFEIVHEAAAMSIHTIHDMIKVEISIVDHVTCSIVQWPPSPLAMGRSSCAKFAEVDMIFWDLL